MAEQVAPLEIVQVAPGEEKVPEPLLENVTVSLTMEPYSPETVAAHTVALPTVTGLGVHETVVEVVAWVDCIGKPPVEAALLASPA